MITATKIMNQEMISRVNSATKYPSIPTYHTIGSNGVLSENINVKFDDDEDVILTEKIDGTNGRIIVMPDGDFFIGSREDILYAAGDRIINTTMNIVNTMLDTAYEIRKKSNNENIFSFFFEVFGFGTGSNAKQYAKTKGVSSLAIFDIAVIDPSVLDMTVEKISSWREHGGQSFIDRDLLLHNASNCNLTPVPFIHSMTGSDMPQSVDATASWLQNALAANGGLISRLRLESDCEGRIEGLVARNKDRSKIVKIRFEDYQRTQRKNK